MQGLISSVGNIDSGGQGEGGSTIIRVKCAMGGVSPTSTTTINGKTYNTYPVSSSYVKFYSVSSLNDEDELSLSEAQIAIAYPISNNNSDCGCNLIINNGALSGNILSTENTLYNIEFVFVYVETLGEQTVTYFQNYVDMVFAGSSGGGNTLDLINLEFDSKIVIAEKQLIKSMIPSRDDSNFTCYGYDAANNLIKCKLLNTTDSLYYGFISEILSGTSPSGRALSIENLSGSFEKIMFAYRRNSGTGTYSYTVEWYSDSTLLQTDNGTASISSSTPNVFPTVDSPGNSNKVVVRTAYSTGSASINFGIYPYIKVACNSKNLPMNGVGYYNLPDASTFVPPSGSYSTISINDIGYQNKDTNYKSGNYLAYFDGENINYVTTTITNT